MFGRDPGAGARAAAGLVLLFGPRFVARLSRGRAGDLLVVVILEERPLGRVSKDELRISGFERRAKTRSSHEGSNRQAMALRNRYLEQQGLSGGRAHEEIHLFIYKFCGLCEVLFEVR
jgi:hypothetical protein